MSETSYAEDELQERETDLREEQETDLRADVEQDNPQNHQIQPERDQLLIGPALFPGDRGELALPLRQALVRLLRGPYVDGGNADGTGAKAFSTIVENRKALEIRLHELFLRLVIDEDRKIALLQPVEMAEPFTTALVRQRELSREETLLLLRMRLILDRGLGRGLGTGTEATINRSEVLDIFAQYLHGGSQDAKGVEELADQTLRRLVNDRRLLLPTELPEVFVISNALPLALPYEQIGDIRKLLDAIADGADDDGGPDQRAADDDGGPHQRAADASDQHTDDSNAEDTDL